MVPPWLGSSYQISDSCSLALAGTGWRLASLDPIPCAVITVRVPVQATGENARSPTRLTGPFDTGACAPFSAPGGSLNTASVCTIPDQGRLGLECSEMVAGFFRDVKHRGEARREGNECVLKKFKWSLGNIYGNLMSVKCP